MPFFLKVTAIVAVGIVCLVLLAALIKIVAIAAIVAALVVGGLAVRNLLRRRRGGPITISQRRY
jgi:hypothetical protein